MYEGTGRIQASGSCAEIADGEPGISARLDGEAPVAPSVLLNTQY
jgi:hypothetical protein